MLPGGKLAVFILFSLSVVARKTQSDGLTDDHDDRTGRKPRGAGAPPTQFECVQWTFPATGPSGRLQRNRKSITAHLHTR